MGLGVMTLSKLKKAIVVWINDRDRETYPDEVAKKFRVPKRTAIKAMLQLHKEGQVVCADGCEKCDVL